MDMHKAFIALTYAGMSAIFAAGVVGATETGLKPMVSVQNAIAADVPQRAVYETLSPGNRLIAEALYSGQKAESAVGRMPWSLERISATRKAIGNWGEVFQQMKDENLLQAESLGQVVSWYQYRHLAPEAASRASVATMPAGD